MTMTINEDLQQQKGRLIERLGVYMENEDQLAPLAARLFATLILTGKTGITFEELVKNLNASKSTICTHLNTLQASGRASYFTKPGDRKRYFIVTSNRLINVMDEMIEKWKSQHEIHKDILNYKIAVNEEVREQDLQFDLDFHKNYLAFLDQASDSMQKLKQNIIEKHHNNE